FDEQAAALERCDQLELAVEFGVRVAHDVLEQLGCRAGDARSRRAGEAARNQEREQLAHGARSALDARNVDVRPALDRVRAVLQAALPPRQVRENETWMQVAPRAVR